MYPNLAWIQNTFTHVSSFLPTKQIEGRGRTNKGITPLFTADNEARVILVHMCSVFKLSEHCIKLVFTIGSFPDTFTAI